MTRLRRAVAAIAAMLTVTVSLAGCALTPAPGPSLPPATAGVDADLLPFYAQTLDWEPCEGDAFQCATVRAPLDWADPAADDIELAVIRHRATSGDPLGSLLTNPGGPGASGYDHVRDAVTVSYSEVVQEEYDIVGFDPRGVGRSAPITCLDADDMDEYLYDIPEGGRGTAAWESGLAEKSQEFVDACEANSGELLPFISTDDAARDMDLLRAVLGDDALNYVGRSWGTALGTAYARLFPQNVGRVVLDGAMDPSVSGAETGATQALGFEESLRAFFADCAMREDCPYRGTADEMMSDLGALLARVDQRPVSAGDGRELGADTLMIAIITTLYAQGSWPFLRVVLTEVEDGVAQSAFTAADSYNRRVGGEYPTNQTEAFTAYNCRDYPPLPVAEEQALEDAVLRDAPVTGPYWFGGDTCAVWPAASAAARGPVTAEGAAPILVIGTTGDPATPYAWAQSLAEQLSSGVLVTRVGEGHTGYAQGNACVDAVVDDYLLDGVVPASDVRCE